MGASIKQLYNYTLKMLRVYSKIGWKLDTFYYIYTK